MRFIVIPRHANAKLSNQCIREKAIVVETGAIGVLKARSFKISLCWSTCYTKYWSLQNGWTLVAKSGAQAIFVGNIGVHFGIHEIRIFVEGQQSKVVVRVSPRIRRRQEGHEVNGDGIDQG